MPAPREAEGSGTVRTSGLKLSQLGDLGVLQLACCLGPLGFRGSGFAASGVYWAPDSRSEKSPYVDRRSLYDPESRKSSALNPSRGSQKLLGILDSV